MPPVATAELDDRLDQLHSNQHECCKNGPSRRSKRRPHRGDTRQPVGGTVGRAIAGASRLHGREALCPTMRSEEHTSELQSLMRISYAVFCLKKNTQTQALMYYI